MPDYVATASGQWEPKTPIDASQTGWLRWLENSVLCVALAALVVLPLLEIVLRATLQTGSLRIECPRTAHDACHRDAGRCSGGPRESVVGPFHWVPS